MVESAYKVSVQGGKKWGTMRQMQRLFLKQQKTIDLDICVSCRDNNLVDGHFLLWKCQTNDKKCKKNSTCLFKKFISQPTVEQKFAYMSKVFYINKKWKMKQKAISGSSSKVWEFFTRSSFCLKFLWKFHN